MSVVDLAENPLAADPAAEAETPLAGPVVLYPDKLEGVAEIAQFVYGESSEQACNRIYHLVGRRVAAKRRLPT